ncbi:sulfatase-like hydrolase/transferase [Natrialbaceae archaeon GCM10025810]|uniref:sulfatase-like hydrolase/transferase n=1 Tax=Halovalidus salilacus TaxID=3075124 RepID=UPI0036163B64
MRIFRTKKHTSFDDAEPPFALLKHDTGAHDPYAHYEMEGRPTSAEFFDQYAGQTEELRKLYKRGVDQAADRVLNCVESLEDKGLLDTTLVFVISDHGELLREQNRGGKFAHSSPMSPELVRVPAVVIGAGLPKGETLDWHLSGIDIAPTL